MSGDETRAEQVLRAVLAERAAGTVPPGDLVSRVNRRHRVRRRMLAAGAAAAAVLVGVGIPAGLTSIRADPPPAAPSPTGLPRPREGTPSPDRVPTGPVVPADGPCLPELRAPLPAPVPADQLPTQSGVRGSLAGDRALVDAVLVVGWRGLRADAALLAGGREMAADTLRLLFVERAGGGTLALVTARDVTGDWGASTWVVGQGRRLRPIGGGGGLGQPGDVERRLGQDLGPDPLYITSQVVCGRTFGVLLAPPDATASISPAPRVGADARLVDAPAEPLPVAGGLAVFPTEVTAKSTVTVSRDGARLAARPLNSERGTVDIDRLLPAGEIARAVDDAGGTPDRTLATNVARGAAAELGLTVSDEIAGVRVPWGGPVPGGRRAVLVALTLPSGAMYIDSAVGERKSSAYGGDFIGLLPAGRLDDGVLSFEHDGLVVVVAPAAARAEIVLRGGKVLPLRLVDGGGGVAVPAGAEATLVRAYRADGSRLGTSVPGTGLLPLRKTL